MYQIYTSRVKTDKNPKPIQYFQYQLEWFNYSLEVYCALPYLFYQWGKQYNQVQQPPSSHVKSMTDMVLLSQSK